MRLNDDDAVGTREIEADATDFGRQQEALVFVVVLEQIDGLLALLLV